MVIYSDFSNSGEDASGMLVANRGSVLWAINHFRKEGLHSLVMDLHALEERGLTDKECDKVQDALADVLTTAATVPAGSYWEASVYGALERFQQHYVRWNSHGPEEANKRRADLSSLRARKRAVSTRIRQHQTAIDKIVKVGMVVEMYEALDRISSHMPALFPNLAKAVKRFRAGLARDGK